MVAVSSPVSTSAPSTGLAVYLAARMAACLAACLAAVHGVGMFVCVTFYAAAVAIAAAAAAAAAAHNQARSAYTSGFGVQEVPGESCGGVGFQRQVCVCAYACCRKTIQGVGSVTLRGHEMRLVGFIATLTGRCTGQGPNRHAIG